VKVIGYRLWAMGERDGKERDLKLADKYRSQEKNKSLRSSDF
jgi:hypothetical protein